MNKMTDCPNQLIPNFTFTIKGTEDISLSICRLSSHAYALDRPYCLTLEGLSPQLIDFQPIRQITLHYLFNDCEYRLHGWISHWTITPQEDGLYYRLTFQSPLFALALSQHNRTWVNQSIIDIIQTVLEPYQLIFPFLQIRFECNTLYHPLPLLIQYEKTDFLFLIDLLQQYHLWFYFESNDSIVQWIVSDHFRFSKIVQLDVIDPAHFTRRSANILELHAEFLQHGHIITFKTDHLGLHPGIIIQINHHTIEDFHRSYRVIEISYQIDCTQQYLLCRAIPLHQSYQPSYPVSPKIESLLLPATIKQREKSDRYTIQFHFDSSQQHISSIPCIRCLEGLSKDGETYGVHFPFPIETEVIIAFENDDLTQPIILGALPSHQCPNVVNYANATQYRIQTQNHSFTLEDQPEHEQINIVQAEHQWVQMNQSHSKPYIHFMSKTGSINLQTQNDFEITCEKNQSIEVQKDRILHSADRQELLIEQGTLLVQAGTDCTIQAHQTIQIQTDHQDITLSADQNLNHQIQYDSEFFSQRLFDLSTEHDTLLKAQNFYGHSSGKIQWHRSMVFHSKGIKISNICLEAPILILSPPIP